MRTPFKNPPKPITQQQLRKKKRLENKDRDKMDTFSA